MKWLRLLIDYDGHKKGELLQIDGTAITEESARTLIAAKVAEDGGAGPDQALSSSVTAELAALRNGLKTAVDGIVDDLRAATTTLKAPRVDPGESEDEKVAQGRQFQGLAHFAQTVRKGCTPGGPDVPSATELARYTGATNAISRAASGLNEAVDPEGGVLIPPERSNVIWERTVAISDLVSRMNFIGVSGNSLTVLALNDSSRLNGFRQGGVQSFWTGEAEQYTKSKPSFRSLEAKLKKLTALTYMTDELMSDPNALEMWLGRAVPKELNFKLSDAILSGTGAGMPKGIRNGENKIVVNKESGQAAATIVYNNIVKMWNRLHAASRKNALWLINQDTEPQLEIMALPTGTASGVPIYNPTGGGANDTALARLKGREVVPIEQCETLGTEGDIVLCDLDNVLGIMKGGVRSAVSIHLRFDYGEVAFRWDIRADTQPYEDLPVTPYKGSTTTSSCVTLQTR
jgi:HK97 family phage major capsid protein